MEELADPQSDPLPTTNEGRFLSMIQKASICILGFLILGMLCVPTAAETGGNAGDNDYWNFYVVDNIYAVSEVKLNGQADSQAGKFQEVRVAKSLDHIDLEFEVTGGLDTNLTITKKYIDKLRNFPPLYDSNQVPTIIAWGGSLTYDVDGAVMAPVLDQPSLPGKIKVYIIKHIVERSFLHRSEVQVMPYEVWCLHTYPSIRYVRS